MLVQHGPSSLTVSLPMKWVKKHHLKKGDEIELEDNGSFLYVKAEQGKRETPEQVLHVEEYEPQYIRLLLNNFYRIGFDTVRITFQSEEQFAVIQELTNQHYLGFEITKKTEKQCVIESVTEPEEEKFDVLLRRTMLIIDETMRMAEEDLMKKKHELSLYVSQQFNKVEQYVNFCLRSINKGAGKERVDLWIRFLYELLVLMGEMNHLYEYLGKNSTLAVSKEAVQFMRKTQEIFHEFTQVFYKKEGLPALNQKARRLLYGEGYVLMKKDPVVMYHLGSLVRRITILLSPASVLGAT